MIFFRLRRRRKRKGSTCWRCCGRSGVFRKKKSMRSSLSFSGVVPRRSGRLTGSKWCLWRCMIRFLLEMSRRSRLNAIRGRQMSQSLSRIAALGSTGSALGCSRQMTVSSVCSDGFTALRPFVRLMRRRGRQAFPMSTSI